MDNSKRLKASRKFNTREKEKFDKGLSMAKILGNYGVSKLKQTTMLCFQLQQLKNNIVNITN